MKLVTASIETCRVDAIDEERLERVIETVRGVANRTQRRRQDFRIEADSRRSNQNR
jgi:hypothetical protein